MRVRTALWLAALTATAALWPAGARGEGRRSGFADMSAATQALQRDDTQNPAMLWVADGESRWREAAPGGSCQSCHANAATSMRGVAAAYPAPDAATGRTVTLSQRIRGCRTKNQRVAASPRDSEIVLALETFVAHQSRGLPITPAKDARLDADHQLGQRLWRQPLGQLALSCAMCHDALAGQRLAGSVIPQGHPTGYPLYRLEWQAVGGLTRRLRNCLVGVRAEPFAPDAPEWAALEVFLMRRAAGMAIETPAVRP